ncbi:MAG: response regulator [Betaproteobacteria bacterium]|nr:response regulator [Betaproteobacteria bacterium]
MKRLLALLPKSLVVRVFALYTVTLLVFGGLGLGTFVAYYVRSDIEDKNITGAMIVEVVAQTTTDSAIIGDYDTIEKTLQRAISRSPFHQAAFIDMIGGKVQVAAPQSSPASAPDFIENWVKSELGDVNRTISVGGRDYGVLRLIFDTDHIAATYWQFARIAFGAGAAAVLGGLFLIWIPVRRWLGNLDRLKAFEADLQAGTLDPKKYLSADAPVEIRRTFELLGRTASSLQSEREQASVTLAAIADAVLALDAAGLVTYANPAAAGLLGLTVEELAGCDVRALLPGAFDPGAPLAPWRSQRLRLASGDTGEHYLDTTLSAIAGTGGGAGGWVLAARDVTEAWRLEERLRTELAARQDALESLRGLLEGLLPAAGHAMRVGSGDIGVVSALVAELVREREEGRRALDNQKFALDQHAIVSVTDREGRIVYANDRFCETTGYRREDLIGSRHSRVSSGIHPPEMYAQLWRTIIEGRVWQGEICNRTADGRLKWFNSTIVPLPGPDGEPEQFIGISTDVTDLKETEAALQRAKDAAESANRAKSDFLANMSHEIRTPMNGIIGMSNLVLDSRLEAEQREYVGIVKSSAEALLVIINDILDFSKIEAGKLVVESLPFDVRRAVDDAMRSLALPAREKGLRLRAEVDAGVPAEVVGDSGRYRQVLMNLVGNAIKFTQEGEVQVRVSTRSGEGEAMVLETSVRDTGIGIGADKLAHIFDAFTQEDTSITRRYGGTGLGLTISRRLVELMDGRIRVESEVGKGSDFAFTVAVRTRAAAMPGEADARVLAGRRVLIVDDAQSHRETLQRLIEGWGMKVEVADSANTALARLLGEAPFDALLLDAELHEMTGAQFALALDQPAYANVRLPIVLLESGAGAGIPPRGVTRVVRTPLAPSDLMDALAFALRRPRSREILSMHVLLVEDNIINERVATAMLEKRGCRVSVAHDGEEALAACESRTFDAVLMDMQMPVMDGLEATRRLREREAALRHARTPVLAMTANAMEEDREACLAAGMDDFLAKPIRPDELFARLERLARPAAA